MSIHTLRLQRILQIIACSLCLLSCLPGASQDAISPLYEEEDSSQRILLGRFGNQPGTGLRGSVFINNIDRRAGRALLIARFIPDEGFSLYSRELSMQGVEGMGRPTLMEIAEEDRGQVAVLGPLHSESVASEKQVLDWIFPLYDPGPVELSLAIGLPEGDGPEYSIDLWFTYMTCSDDVCLRPVEREALAVLLPTVLPESTETDVAEADVTETAAIDPSLLLHRGQWYYPKRVSELESLINAADKEGLTIFLEFTGPSCVICQWMKQGSLSLPEVREAMQDMLLISINTDPPHADLAAWQVEEYATFARPFYVRRQGTDPGQAWTTAFAPRNQEQLNRFLSFLAGGAGDSDASAVADSVASAGGWWRFILLALFSALLTLIMPCTYPMIPLTINFFTSQQQQGRHPLPLAATYGLGIVIFFLLLGTLFALVIGNNPAYVAGHWMTNLFISLLFIFLGASLLGAFFLRLPSSLNKLTGGSQRGYTGALGMGLTFALVSFSCTAPFVGFVLGAAILSGSWQAAIIGMTSYALVLAIPFFLLALAPGLIHRLPGSGSWMQDFKIIAGLVQVGVALRFLHLTDHALSWGIFGRDFILALWAGMLLAITAYLAGWIRMDESPAQPIGAYRLGTLILALALALLCISGLLGNSLGMLEALFPAYI